MHVGLLIQETQKHKKAILEAGASCLISLVCLPFCVSLFSSPFQLVFLFLYLFLHQVKSVLLGHSG